jgi:hypothetical protein
MSFTVTALAGYTLSVTGLSFDERNLFDLGPDAFEVFTSADGFTSAVLSGLLLPDAATFTNHSTALAFSGLVSPFEVRIVSSGGLGPDIGSTWLLDNITLSARAVVPEPAMLLLVVTGLGLVTARRQFRKRS